MDNENLLMRKIQLFLESNMYENYNIKFATTNYNVSHGMHSFISTLYKVNPAIFDYTRILHNLVRLSTQRINDVKMLMPNIESNFDSLKNKPFLFVAPGPSLSKEIEWIKENQNKFIIVAIGASYNKLLEYEITPDLLSNVESSYKDLKKFQFKDLDKSRLDNTVKLFSIITPPQISDLFDDKDTFYYEVNYSLKDKKDIYKGYSVGEITVSLLLDLGIKDLYLIGTDLSVDKETGNSHFGYKDGGEINHDLNKDYDITENLSNNKTSFKEELIPVEGNFEKEVYTTRIFMNSIFSYAQSIQQFKKENQTIKNLSTFGAKLHGTIPFKTSDINLEEYNTINKKDLKEEVLKYLNSISESKLTEKEAINLKKEISYFKGILEEISKYDELEVKNYFEFYDIITDVENKIKLIGYPTFLNFQMQSYFKFINTYLCYHFNDKKVKNEANKLIKIKEIWLKQVKRLINEYINYFERIKI